MPDTDHSGAAPEGNLALFHPEEDLFVVLDETGSADMSSGSLAPARPDGPPAITELLCDLDGGLMPQADLDALLSEIAGSDAGTMFADSAHSDPPAHAAISEDPLITPSNAGAVTIIVDDSSNDSIVA